MFLKGRKIRLVDDGISLWTGMFNWFTPGYSHMSVWKQDENGRFTELDDVIADAMFAVGGITKRNYLGTCYTSTMRGKDNGTVSRPASTVFTHPERWEYIEFEVRDESFEAAKRVADIRVGRNKGYSTKDIRRFFMPLWLLIKLGWDDPEREICSEHGETWAVILRSATNPVIRLLPVSLIRSPRRLWRDLVRRHKVATYSLATGKMVRDENGKKVKA